VTSRVEVNRAAVTEIEHSPGAEEYLARVGDAIAEDAAIAAPKLTGHGASTIHGEVGHDTEGAYVRISWDTTAWYLKFAELGTSHENPRPFLRPAAEKQRVI
jgi:HK97 gp10 family phage protein